MLSPLRDGLGQVRGLMNMSKVITDRYVPDVYPFAGGGGSDPRSALPPRCHVVEHARRRPRSASGQGVASRLHYSYKQGDRGSTEDDPFALAAPVPGVQHNAALRARGNDVSPGLHNSTEGNSLRFRWNGLYPESSWTGGYCTLYLLTGQQTTNTATLMHVGARHYSPSLRRWLQRDPVHLIGGHPNLYVYAFGSPVNFVDPSGNQTGPKVADRGAMAGTTHALPFGHTFLVVRRGLSRISVGFYATDWFVLSCEGQWFSPEPHEDDRNLPEGAYVNYIEFGSELTDEQFEQLWTQVERIARASRVTGDYRLLGSNCTTHVMAILSSIGYFVADPMEITPYGYETMFLCFRYKLPGPTLEFRRVRFPGQEQSPRFQLKRPGSGGSRSGAGQ